MTQFENFERSEFHLAFPLQKYFDNFFSIICFRPMGHGYFLEFSRISKDFQKFSKISIDLTRNKLYQ